MAKEPAKKPEEAVTEATEVTAPAEATQEGSQETQAAAPAGAVAPTEATPPAPAGTVVETVEVSEPQPAKSDTMANIVTTRVGTFDAGGIIPVGKKATIDVKAFSAKWMKPADAASAKLIKAELARRAK